MASMANLAKAALTSVFGGTPITGAIARNASSSVSASTPPTRSPAVSAAVPTHAAPATLEVDEYEAIYPYSGQGPQQLTFALGDIFVVSGAAPAAGWLDVTDTKGQRGIVPESYVKKMEKPAPPEPTPAAAAATIAASGRSTPTVVVPEEPAVSIAVHAVEGSVGTVESGEGHGRNVSATATATAVSALRARVLYDYVATSELQLSVKAGDELHLSVPDESRQWWEVLNIKSHQRGCVPASYLKPLPLNPDEQPLAVEAIFSYSATEPLQLSITAGERLTVISQLMNAGWWLARRDSEGIFGQIPSNYVKKIDKPALSVNSNLPQMPNTNVDVTVLFTAVAQFDFNATEPEQLSFPRGALIEVIERDDNDAWGVGRIQGSNAAGAVPLAYLKPHDSHKPVANVSTPGGQTANGTNSHGGNSSGSLLGEQPGAVDSLSDIPPPPLSAVSAGVTPPPPLSSTQRASQSNSLSNSMLPATNAAVSAAPVTSTPSKPIHYATLTTPITTAVHASTAAHSGSMTRTHSATASLAAIPSDLMFGRPASHSTSNDILRQYMFATPPRSTSSTVTMNTGGGASTTAAGKANNKTFSSAELMSALFAGGNTAAAYTPTAQPAPTPTAAPAPISSVAASPMRKDTSPPPPPLSTQHSAAHANEGLSAATPASGAPATEVQLFTATHAYTAQTPEQLSFVKGDTFTVINHLNAHWYYARAANGIAGQVPAAYVRGANSSSGGVSGASSASASSDSESYDVIAAHDYQAKSSSETPLLRGQLLRVRAGPEGWLYLASEGKLLPASYVHRVLGVATALHEYPGASGSPPPNALNFPKDAKIFVTAKQDVHWNSGYYEGKSGIFPVSYVSFNNPAAQVGESASY